MAVAKRELGRTGLQVTTLGYGAMELRGAPRGRDIKEEQAETILNTSLSPYLNRGIDVIDAAVEHTRAEKAMAVTEGAGTRVQRRCRICTSVGKSMARVA